MKADKQVAIYLRASANGQSTQNQRRGGRRRAALMNKQVAAKLNVSEVTVKVHRHSLMKKLRAKSLPVD